MVVYGAPTLFTNEYEADEVHISVTFSWDLDMGHRIADAWDLVFPGRVKIGGPAFNQRGGDFVGGRYLAPGYTITSRGCPNRCWFCRVPKVEGNVRELPIVDGWNVLDDNILATSWEHFDAVCSMLQRNTFGRSPEFTGGLDAELLTDRHVNRLAEITPRPSCFFAYDPGDEYDTLGTAAQMMFNAGWTVASHRLRCYVLIGYPKDTTSAAVARLNDMLGLGFTPMAMLWRNPKTGEALGGDWKTLQRMWARPAIIHANRAAMEDDDE